MRHMNKLMRWPFIPGSCTNKLATENEPRVKWTAVRFWNRGTTIHKRSSMTKWEKNTEQKIWKKSLDFFPSFPTYPAFGVKNDAHNIAFKMTNQFYVCAVCSFTKYVKWSVAGRYYVPLPAAADDDDDGRIQCCVEWQCRRGGSSEYEIQKLRIEIDSIARKKIRMQMPSEGKFCTPPDFTLIGSWNYHNRSSVSPSVFILLNKYVPIFISLLSYRFFSIFFYVARLEGMHMTHDIGITVLFGWSATAHLENNTFEFQFTYLVCDMCTPSVSGSARMEGCRLPVSAVLFKRELAEFKVNAK